VTVDLQEIKNREVKWELLTNTSEFSFTLPNSKNEVTFKILTVGDDKRQDEEIKGLKKTAGIDAGQVSTKLKYQITSVNGDRSQKTVREFIDEGYLLAMDALELRKYMNKVTPDIDTKVSFKLSDGEEITIDLPLGGEFFFPGSGE
jgi:hypothetical protein